MKTLLAVSPHLDDAVFSAGAELVRRADAGWRVLVCTCFTGSVANPQGFALACQLDKGLGPEVDYMALRRDEDRAACAALGAEPIHLPFLEAPHRGYHSAAALFGPPLDEAALEDELAVALGRIDADELFAPAALGDHVDHHLVRRIVQRLQPRSVQYWADMPYAARLGGPPDGWDGLACGPALARKRAAAACYRSQLAFQFGATVPPDHLLALHGAEWFIR